MLIVGRLRLGLSQKELARRLGMRMQQVQRYEKERYRSISLSNYRKVAAVVGIRPHSELLEEPRSGWVGAQDISVEEARKVVRHARKRGWIEGGRESIEDGLAQLKKDIAEHVVEYSRPSMLRTGLNVREDVVDDWSLLAWKSQITRRAETIAESLDVDYNPLDLGWLTDLVRLSSDADGPRLAIDFLLQRGIVVVAEPAVPGMPLDGAAFVVNGVPVVGLTLRHDRLDNFWFTLLHEIAHVVLHYRTGLATGFFDDIDKPTRDDLELEANEFASELLLPEHRWKRSPARIAMKPGPIIAFAKALGVHPAIVFGRIRKERDRYDLFSQYVGHRGVRKHFEDFNEKEPR